MIRKEISADKALMRLQDLCARAERSEGECREKLRQWGIDSTTAEKIMDRLRSDRYVDDHRFADAYTTDKVRFARWGRRKIQVALMQKRVAPAIIAEALDNIDEDVYVENLRYLFSRKTAADPELKETYEGRAKLYRFLLSRGYEPYLVSKVLEQ